MTTTSIDTYVDPRMLEHPEEYVWIEHPDWRVSKNTNRRCRRPHCYGPSAAYIMRVHSTRRMKSKNPWHYCANHLYGNIIYAGKVLTCVHKEVAAHQQIVGIPNVCRVPSSCGE